MVHNERIKLLASALNTVGLAFAIGGFVAPSINGQILSEPKLTAFIWLAMGTALHFAAQSVLGGLKP